MQRWPEIRSGLIALAIAVGLLDGCPIPSAGERPVMERRLSPGMVAAVDAVDDVRTTLLRPFRAIRDTAGLRQRWKLFSGAGRDRYRMRIDARTATSPEWHLLYRVLDEDHDFLAAAIEYRRVRAAWNRHTTTGKRAGYPHFVRWIAGEVFARLPEYTEVRVQHERIEIGEHGGYRVTGEVVDTLSVRR